MGTNEDASTAATEEALPGQGELLEIGYVARAHGLKGEVRVIPHWEGSDALYRAKVVVLASEEERAAVAVESARPSSNGILVRFEGALDRDSADSFKGKRVLVSRSELPPLEDDEYFLADLVGAMVYAPDGLVGTVIRIGLHPSVDTIVVRSADGQEFEQPLTDPWLEHVDVAAKRIQLSSREGLI